MKKKCISAAMLSVLLLVLFLPVLYYVIFYGTNINYNEMHKIVTLEGNKVLSLCAVIGAAVLGVIWYFLRRIPYTRRTAMGFAGITLVICIVFYFINVNISKCIAFYGGWDCGMVANSVHWIVEGSGLGYNNYYTIYSNNIPITWLLYKLYCFTLGLKNYPYNPEFIWIQFQCVMLSLAVFCAVLLVLFVTKKIGTAILTLVFHCIFLGISPWKMVPYTDGSTIAIPVLLLLLYVLFRNRKSRWRYGLWGILMLCGVLGGIMKATCYVTLIAVLLVDLVWSVLEEEVSVRARLCGIGGKLVLLILAFCVGALCKQGIYRTLNYEYDANLEIGWSNYMYNGLNEDTTGACSGEGLDIVHAFEGADKADRVRYEINGIRKRLQDRGVLGTIRFWLRKQVMNFNDGTFSWYQEGYFQAWDYPLEVESSWKEPLRNFYWEDGSNYIWFTTISQGLWLFVLLGVVTKAVMTLETADRRISGHHETRAEGMSDDLCLSTVMIVTFIGMFLFVMLFEARARYLYNTIPVFSVMAILGYCELYQKICTFCDERRK